MNNKLLSTTKMNSDLSIIKYIDIRQFATLMYKCNFSDLQILYSVEKHNTSLFEWFFEHRNEILRHNLSQLYTTNVGFINSSLHRYKISFNYKDLIRAEAFKDLLLLIASEQPFTMLNEKLRTYRRFETPIYETDILKAINSVKDYFINKSINLDIKEQIYLESKKILVYHLNKEIHNKIF